MRTYRDNQLELLSGIGSDAILLAMVYTTLLVQLRHFIAAGALAIVLSLSHVNLTHAEYIYDFDNLSEGELGKQGEWRRVFAMHVEVVSGKGENDTMVLQNIHGGDAGAIRLIDQSPYSSKETNAVFEVDMQIGERSEKFSRSLVGLTGLGDDGKPSTTFWVGIFQTLSKQEFRFIVEGPENRITYRSKFPESVNPGDWLRMQLTMDFTAEKNGGTASLSFLNLTQNPEDLQDTDIINESMYLKGWPVAVADPSMWSGIIMRLNNINAQPETAIRVDRIVLGAEK